MRSLLMSRARNASFLSRATIPPGKHLRVMAGFDNLTSGGGVPTFSSYLDAFRGLLRGRYGNGGSGVIWADVLSPGYFAGATTGTVSSFLNANPAWNAAPRSHSLCGQGTAFSGVTGGFLGLDPAEPWDLCRVYFELASGGSFGIVATGTGALGEVVDTARFPTGQLCAVDLRPASSGETGITIFSVAGTVTVFGAEFLNEAGGATLTNCAVSGSQLADHAGLDDGWARAWNQMLRPDVLIFNGGMVEREAVDVSGYADLVNMLVGRWLASGSADILLVRPNDTIDWDSTYLSRYDTVLKATALGRGCAYVDDRTALGAYAAAAAAGYMADTIYPSPTGNAKRAAAYFAAFS